MNEIGLNTYKCYSVINEDFSVAKDVIHVNNRLNNSCSLYWCFPPQAICHTRLKLNTSWQKNWDDEARVHFFSQTGWPSDPLPSGYISPQSAIRHQRVRGREIHQNSLCSVRYTKEPLRIRDGLLCLWLSTLRPIPSSPRLAWCELINHSNGLTWQTITCTVLLLHSLSVRLCTHQRREIAIKMHFHYTFEYCNFFESFCSFLFACIWLFRY